MAELIKPTVEMKKAFNKIAKDNELKNFQYIEIMSDMGCNWYMRFINNKYEYLFMHSDNWGQYGPETSDLPKYTEFIKNFTKIGNNISYSM